MNLLGAFNQVLFEKNTKTFSETLLMTPSKSPEESLKLQTNIEKIPLRISENFKELLNKCLKEKYLKSGKKCEKYKSKKNIKKGV